MLSQVVVTWFHLIISMTLPFKHGTERNPIERWISGSVLRLPWIFHDRDGCPGISRSVSGAFRSWARRCSTCPAMSRNFATIRWPRSRRASRARAVRHQAVRAFLETRREEPWGVNATGSEMLFLGLCVFFSWSLGGLEDLAWPKFLAQDVDGDWEVVWLTMI